MAARTPAPSTAEALRWLAAMGTEKQVAELARYGITATRPYGVAVGELERYATQVGREDALAAGLWKTRRYEARMRAAFVDEPERVLRA